MNKKQILKALDQSFTHELINYHRFKRVLPHYHATVDIELKVGDTTWTETRNILTDRPNGLFRQIKRIKAVKSVTITIL